MMDYLGQIILLLVTAIVIVVLFRRLHIPTSLGYLLVGIIVGPHTIGPVVSMPGLHALAEFGVVFLLFTIGLNFSLPRIHALRHQVLGLGTGQVAFTTIVAGLIMWLAGLPAAAAFVFGAAFAQSSTTIIASLLSEQGEENTPHGRLGLAMSVFQDVTAVPFIVVIPVLGASVAASALAATLGIALGKAVMAFALVFFAGRWLLRPLFRAVSGRRSGEVFTLAVLLVALLAAWITNSLGLSLAFGGFIAGMVLGETEFRHQVESSIGPFRDVLLGLFFIGIGMRFNPMAIPPIWYWVVLCSLLIVTSKTLLVAAMVRRTGADARMSWQTGLMLGVGGEFGLALIAIALDSGTLSAALGQIAISSVLLSMVLGALLIRFNGAIAARLAAPPGAAANGPGLEETAERQVVIGGYGRVGHTIAVLLHARGIPFVAIDSDPARVAQGRADGHAVWLGNVANPTLLSSLHVERAALMVIAVDDPETAVAAMGYIQRSCPQVPVIARARDLATSGRLLGAGALHAYPEAIESSLQLGAAALQVLNLPADEVEDTLQDLRDRRYQPILEDESAR